MIEEVVVSPALAGYLMAAVVIGMFVFRILEGWALLSVQSWQKAWRLYRQIGWVEFSGVLLITSAAVFVATLITLPFLGLLFPLLYMSFCGHILTLGQHWRSIQSKPVASAPASTEEVAT